MKPHSSRFIPSRQACRRCRQRPLQGAAQKHRPTEAQRNCRKIRGVAAQASPQAENFQNNRQRQIAPGRPMTWLAPAGRPSQLRQGKQRVPTKSGRAPRTSAGPSPPRGAGCRRKPSCSSWQRQSRWLSSPGWFGCRDRRRVDRDRRRPALSERLPGGGGVISSSARRELHLICSTVFSL
jgi:hypothetical protein